MQPLTLLYGPCCIMRLAGLRSPAMYGARGLTCAGVAHLTRLKSLAVLRVQGCDTTFHHHLLFHGELSRKDIDLMATCGVSTADAFLRHATSGWFTVPGKACRVRSLIALVHGQQTLALNLCVSG